MNDTVLRRNLLELLDMGSAHINLDDAIEGLAAFDAFRRPPGAGGNNGLHSVWELLEHMRIGQEDLLHYTMDPSWESPPWPQGYWPTPVTEPEHLSVRECEEKWMATLEGFRRDLGEVRGWVKDPELELSAQLPHGEGRTYLRQIQLVADHNAYHLGQIVYVRRMLGLWR